MHCTLADDSGLSEPAAESSLRSTDVNGLSEALLALAKYENGEIALSKSARAVERVRRSCSKIVDRSNREGAPSGESTMTITARQWLVAAIELVEDLLQASSLVRGSPQCLSHANC